MVHYVYLLADKKHGTLYLCVMNDIARRVLATHIARELSRFRSNKVVAIRVRSAHG
jgi:predicted GIY-YIG superfamily endonuclease